MEPPQTKGTAPHTEEMSLMHHSDEQNFAEDDYPQRVSSQTSLSSFIQVKKDKLASIPETMMNTFKAFIGTGILGMYSFNRHC